MVQEGPLTVAARQGRWLVIEDIDLASFDVLSVLIPLIDTGVLNLQDREIRAAPVPYRPKFI